MCVWFVTDDLVARDNKVSKNKVQSRRANFLASIAKM